MGVLGKKEGGDGEVWPALRSGRKVLFWLVLVLLELTLEPGPVLLPQTKT